jgi:hypothetical protein
MTIMTSFLVSLKNEHHTFYIQLTRVDKTYKICNQQIHIKLVLHEITLKKLYSYFMFYSYFFSVWHKCLKTLQNQNTFL